MNHLHKEKERLRHQKQVKLLNNVMEYVPQISSESQSKVRKLRHLVLYFHYLQIVHSKLTQGLCNNTKVGENCVKSVVTELASKSTKVLHQPKRNTRAHIVFLHADKSANCKNVLKNHMAHYNDHKVHSGDQESTSVLPSDYEYKVPDVVSVDSRINISINQEDTFIPEDSNSLQHIKDYSMSSNNSAVPSKFIIHNNGKTYNDLDSKVASKNFCFKEKEHFLPVIAESKVFNVTEFEESSMYDVDKFAQSIVINDENLRASKHKLNNFHTHLTNDHDNHILESFEFSNVKNKNFKIPHVSTSNKGEEYLLNSNESDTIQNFNSVYDFPSFTTNHFQNSGSYCNVWHNSDFSLNSESKQPIYCDQASVIENTSNYSISSTSTNRTAIDIDNLSDSNTSYNNLSDSSNSTQYNSYNSYINPTCNPLNKVTKFEPMEMEPDVFHLFPPNFSYIGSNGILMNEGLTGQMYDTNLPHFSSIYPSKINCSRSSNSSATFQPDSIYPFYNGGGESENYYKDLEFLYSPLLYNSIHSEQLSVSSPKPKVTHFSNPPESFTTESVKPPFFEEEISYPLAQFLSN